MTSITISIGEIVDAVHDFFADNADRIRYDDDRDGVISIADARSEVKYVVDDYRRHGEADKADEIEEEYRAVIKLSIDTMIHSLAYVAVVNKFNSVPVRYKDAFKELAQKLTIPECKDEPIVTSLDDVVAVPKDATYQIAEYGEAWTLFNPLYTLASELLAGQKFNPWSMVDFKVRDNVMTLNIGEDLRHEVFNRICADTDFISDGHWQHSEFDATGNVVDGVFNLRLTEVDTVDEDDD